MKKLFFEILSSSIFLMINKKNNIITFLVLTDNKFCKLMTTKGKMPKEKKTLDFSSEIPVWIQFTRILMLQTKKRQNKNRSEQKCLKCKINKICATNVVLTWHRELGKKTSIKTNRTKHATIMDLHHTWLWLAPFRIEYV